MTLDDACTDSLGIGLAKNRDGLHRLDLCGAISRFTLLRRAIDSDELSKAGEPIMQRRRHSGAVRGESIRGDLERRARRRVPNTFNENVCGRLVALAESDVQNQLSVAFNRNENISVSKILIVFGPDTFLFLADVGPQFIAFHVPYFHVADFVGHNPFALFASQNQEFENRSVMNTSDSLNRGNAIAFE
jgi:hypothetical protein